MTSIAILILMVLAVTTGFAAAWNLADEQWRAGVPALGAGIVAVIALYRLWCDGFRLIPRTRFAARRS